MSKSRSKWKGIVEASVKENIETLRKFCDDKTVDKEFEELGNEIFEILQQNEDDFLGLFEPEKEQLARYILDNLGLRSTMDDYFWELANKELKLNVIGKLQLLQKLNETSHTVK